MKTICKKLVGVLLISILLTSVNISLAASQSDIESNNKKITET